MKIIGVVFGSLIILVSCAKREPSNKILIEGNVKNVPDGKVYLADAYQWDILLDSAEIKDGRFVFDIKPDSSFIPQQVGIQYHYEAMADSLDRLTMSYGFKRLFFRNHTFGADSLKNYLASFILEKGYTRITGDNEGKGKVRIFAGRQSEVMFKNMKTDFGWLGNMEGDKRLAKIKFFKKEIRENPDSYFLLEGIRNNKEQFSEQELREILALFNKDVQESVLGSKVKMYLSNRVDPDQPYPNFTLLGPDKRQGWIMNNASKVNMLVFWASWCGPCRKEIPQIKEIYKEYEGRDLNLVSISIDKKPEDWQRALSQEKMGWPQFIVEKDQIDEIQQKFNFSAIPLVIITDSRGKEIKRFIGNGPENIKVINEAISNHLAKKGSSLVGILNN